MSGIGSDHISDFLADGAEVLVSEAKSSLSSTISMMAAILGVGAPLVFVAPTPLRDVAPSSMSQASDTTSVEPATTRPDETGPELRTEPGRPNLRLVESKPEAPMALSGMSAPALPRMVAAGMGIDPGPLPPRMKAGSFDFDGIFVPKLVAEAILDAARTTGADPALMMAMADKESSFQTRAKASTSSALGLYQFLDLPWLEVVNRYGAKHGLAAEAASIVFVKGKPHVEDPVERRRILDLRADPRLSALMACETTRSHVAALDGEFGKVKTQQAYLAHFMGLNGAQKLLRAANATPDKIGAQVFPKAAKSNPGIFKGGPDKRQLTVQQIEERLSKVIASKMSRYSDVEAKVDARKDASPDADGGMISLSFRM